MPGRVLHLGATVICIHAGQAMPTAPNTRVTVSGQFVSTIAAPYAVVGCGLTGTPNPPCATANWIVFSTRVLAGGSFVVHDGGQAVCVPTGAKLQPVVSQIRVTVA